MKLSQNGYKFISAFEGVKNNAYQDQRGIWTIGIGFIQVNGHPVNEGMTMTNEQIQSTFLAQIATYESAVNQHVISKINQNQFDALVSFAYNLGVGSLLQSTLLKKVNANPNDTTITQEFEKWDHAGVVISQGLLRRRTAEAALYFTHMSV